MHAALIQGVTDKKKNKIPANIDSCGIANSIGSLITPTLNIITGMLKIITIILPIAKFLLFIRFIDPDIDASKVKIGELIRKVKEIKYKLFMLKLSINNPTGRKTIKGS